MIFSPSRWSRVPTPKSPWRSSSGIGITPSYRPSTRASMTDIWVIRPRSGVLPGSTGRHEARDGRPRLRAVQILVFLPGACRGSVVEPIRGSGSRATPHEVDVGHIDELALVDP